MLALLVLCWLFRESLWYFGECAADGLCILKGFLALLRALFELLGDYYGRREAARGPFQALA